MINQYYDEVCRILSKIIDTEFDKLEMCGKVIAEAFLNEGIVYLFGSGHSHILTEEVFYRAGGLAPIKPILHDPLMLHHGGLASSQLERQNDYVKTFIGAEEMSHHDVLIVISTSGKNPVPIDVALYGKEMGTTVIGITSEAYASEISKHKSGYLLKDVVDICLNNHAVKGDAVLSLQGFETPFTPASTIAGTFIIQSMLSEAIKLMHEQGVLPPVFLSGNIDNADEHNQKLLDHYSKRIPMLVKA